MQTLDSVCNTTYTTIINQIENMTVLFQSEGNDKAVARLGSLLAIVETNFELILNTANEFQEETNKFLSERSKLLEFKECFIDLQSIRDDELRKVKEIEIAHEAIRVKNRALVETNKNLQVKVGTIPGIEKKLQRSEEEVTSIKKEANEHKAKLQEANSKLNRAYALLDLGYTRMMYLRECMILEGRSVSFSLQDPTTNLLCYCYKKAGNIADWDNVFDAQLSHEHQYYIRVETNCGYHWDVMPKLGGGVVIAKGKTMPTSIKKYLEKEFAASTEYNPEDVVNSYEDKLGEFLKELEKDLSNFKHFLFNIPKATIPKTLQTQRKKKR